MPTSTSLLLLLPAAIAFLLSACARLPTTSDPTPFATGFTPGIEGPAFGPDGRLYAVNFDHEGTISVVDATGKASVFTDLPEGSIGNGIRFGESGHLYLADYKAHKVWRIDAGDTRPYVWAENAAMSQPNDLAIAPNGTIYLSDPNWVAGTGRIWRVTPAREIELLVDSLGTTNGIEVSPDGRFLYVNESAQRRLWRFTIEPDGSLSAKQLLREWPDDGLDGMRCDQKGLIYVARYGASAVEILSPSGKTLHTIKLQGEKPSNVTFGGPDGRTVYVTLADKGWIESFRVNSPGRR